MPKLSKAPSTAAAAKAAELLLSDENMPPSFTPEECIEVSHPRPHALTLTTSASDKALHGIAASSQAEGSLESTLNFSAGW
jgi:hypothetical protein